MTGFIIGRNGKQLKTGSGRTSKFQSFGSSGGVGGLYPNRPSAFTSSSEIDFSQAIPTPPGDVDRPIIGAPDWNMIYFLDGSNNPYWTQTTEATAPQSAPGTWVGHWAPGAYGGGVLNEGSGHGIGNVFTYGPGGVFLDSGILTRLYMSLRLYFNFPDASYWHPISNKFVNLTGDNSLILMQLFEGVTWRHAEELSGTGSGGFGVDFNGTPLSIPGLVDNRVVPINQWVQIELVIDIPNQIYRVWQDGVLTTDATPPYVSTKIYTVGINAFRGGGGETLDADLYYKYDHFFIAW